MNLLIDIPMNDETFDPPVKTKEPSWCSTGHHIATLDSRPDALFECGEPDEGRDGDDCMIGVRYAGQWIRDVVLDCEGDFVGGDGRELVLGHRGDRVDGIDWGRGRVVGIRGFYRRALRHGCRFDDRNRGSASWASASGRWQHMSWRHSSNRTGRAPVDITRGFCCVGWCFRRSCPLSMPHAFRTIPFPLRLPQSTFKDDGSTIFFRQEEPLRDEVLHG